MSWYEKNYSNKEWIDILNKFDLQSFKSIDIGYSTAHNKLSFSKIIYNHNHEIKSVCLIKYFYKFGVFVVNIDGGIEGEINKKIIIDLLFFLKKKFKVFILKIDHQNLEHSHYFDDLGFFNLVNKKRFDQYKIFESIIDEKNLLESFSQYWRRNYKRSKRNKLDIKNNDLDFDKNLSNIFEELSQIKKIKNMHNSYTLKSILTNFKENLFISKAYYNNKLVSLRAIIFFKKTCWDILSATTMEGRKNYASYAVTYEILKFCLNSKIDIYKLSGVDPINNKSVYNFKKGIGSNTYEIANEKIYSNFFLFKFFIILIYKFIK